MSTCKYCNAPIGWNRIAGKWTPTNADGSAHYCAKATRAVYDVAHRVGKTVRGAQYQPCCGECGSPPWEHCACSRFLQTQGGQT